mmetsp:Transcript_28504/g.55809  ORF Transcript_28504/g.55809 Transcript_28504/m.55809 type:complete len:219 (-) Transcript_28504:183-839(-)
MPGIARAMSKSPAGSPSACRWTTLWGKPSRLSASSVGNFSSNASQCCTSVGRLATRLSELTCFRHHKSPKPGPPLRIQTQPVTPTARSCGRGRTMPWPRSRTSSGRCALGSNPQGGTAIVPSRFRPPPLPPALLALPATLALLLTLLPPPIVPILTLAAALPPPKGAAQKLEMVLAPPVAILTEALPPQVEVDVKAPRPQEEVMLAVELVRFVTKFEG